MELSMHDIKGLFSGSVDRKKASRLALYLILPLALLLASFVFYGRYASLKKAVEVKKADLKRFSALREDYLKKKTAVDAISVKAAPPGVSNVAVMEALARRIGVKDKIASIKPLEEKLLPGYIDKGLEVKLEGMDLNELINLLYQAEANDYLITVTEFSMKSRFENPDLLDVTLKASFISRAQ